MKKYIYSVLASFTVLLCSAQISITQAEYFWDTDPGQGLGVAVTATDGNFNSAFEQLSKTGIATPAIGLHKFCIRIKDNTGVWGPVFTNIIYIESTVTTTLINISQAEFFWDTDPGQGNGTALLAVDGNFDNAFEQFFKNAIPIVGPVGLHTFNVRIKDNTGVWSPIFKNVIYIQTALGIQDNELSNLVVYPNPVTDVLNLSLETTISSISIYNTLGQQLMTKTLNSAEAKIDVSHLASGTYFVKVTADNKVKTLKVIKN